jgi:hypothetical protein
VSRGFEAVGCLLQDTSGLRSPLRLTDMIEIGDSVLRILFDIGRENIKVYSIYPV